jgi:hypothetical protein
MFKVDGLEGQWQRIPNPDEMQEAWAGFGSDGNFQCCYPEKGTAIDHATDSYYIKPVYIVLRESEVEK